MPSDNLPEAWPERNDVWLCGEESAPSWPLLTSAEASAPPAHIYLSCSQDYSGNLGDVTLAAPGSHGEGQMLVWSGVLVGRAGLELSAKERGRLDKYKLDYKISLNLG